MTPPPLDLTVARRLRKAAAVLADPTHPYHDRLCDDLDAWIEMDTDGTDWCRAQGIPRPDLGGTA